MDGLLFGLVAGVGEEDHVIVDFGLEVAGALPDFVKFDQWMWAGYSSFNPVLGRRCESVATP